MTVIATPQFRQSLMMSIARRTPISTSDAARKFASQTNQTERMVSMPQLRGSVVDVRG